MSIEKQKEVTNKVLDTLRSNGFNDVLVCGGAPRDWYMGNEANDVDVYVGRSSDAVLNFGYLELALNNDLGVQDFRYMVDEDVETASDVEIGSILLGLDPPKVKTTVPDQYRHNKYLNQVTECTVEGVKFQFMDITGTTTAIGSYAMFPFNLCLATYDGERIRTSELFGDGIHDKVLCKINQDYDEEETYVKKIKSRFPDYTYCSKVTEWLIPE